VLHLAARANVDRDLDGAAVRVRGVVLDVTGRKDAELELHRSREELGHLSRVATLGEISSGIAHELSQPLAAILSNAQAARRFLDADPQEIEEVRAILEDIVRDDKRAGAVIHRLRAMLSKQAPASEIVDLNEVAREAVHILNGEIVGRDVAVELDLTSDATAVEASRVEFLQVLVNLILNATQAMSVAPPADRLLRIGTRREDDLVRLVVFDTGPGISPEVLPRIFEPFVTTKPGGLGIGLALCRRMVEAHGGSIEARNLPEGGASLTIEMPAWRKPVPRGSVPLSGRPGRTPLAVRP